MAEEEVVADGLGIIQVQSDGSFIRRFDPALNYPLCQQPWQDDRGVIVKDVADPESLYRLRLYLPKSHLHTETTKLPVIMYYHGGGLRASLLADGLGNHRLCVKWAAAMGAIVVAVNYRVSPENRLPAAYEDSMAALEWLRIQMMRSPSEPWLSSYSDLGNVYLAGDSAGGNIVHYLLMAMQGEEEKWKPLQIKGAIMVQPAFGSQERTQSEMNGLSRVLSISYSDWLWKLALPVGADRDHRFCNPVANGLSDQLISAQLPKLLVVIGGRDLLRDKDVEYCEVMKKSGKQIDVVEFEEEDHAFYTIKLEGESSQKLLDYASHFIKSDQ